MQTIQKSPASQQGKNKNLNISLDNHNTIKNEKNQEKNDFNKVVNLYETYEDYRLPQNYIIDNNNLSRKVLVEISYGGRDRITKEETQTICKFFIVNKIIKQKDNTLLNLKFKNNEEIIAEATIIADAKKLAEVFCKNNIIVTAKTARVIIEYIAEFLKLNDKKIDIVIEKNETGWSEKNEIFYMPTTCSEDTLFTDNIADSIYTSGEKEKQIKLIQEIFNKHAGASVIVLLGLLNQLIKILKIQNYAVLTAGKTGAGKTLANKVMLSLYGNPDVLISNLNMTINAVELKMSTFKDLPNLLDELETSGKTAEQIHNNIVHLIYNYTTGRGRGRMLKNQTAQKVNMYRSCIFLTSERGVESILNSNTSEKANHGVIRRTIEINTKRIKLFNDDVKYGEIANSINQNFGFIGPDWIQYITDNYDEIEWDYISMNKRDDRIDILEFLKTVYKHFIKMLKIQENKAIIDTINLIIKDNEKIYTENIENEEDKYEDYLQEFLVINYNNMIDKIEEAKARNKGKSYKISSSRLLGQINGEREEYSHYLTSEFINELCRKYKIDKNNFIENLKEKEILKIYKNVKINRQVTKAYCIKI